MPGHGRFGPRAINVAHRHFDLSAQTLLDSSKGGSVMVHTVPAAADQGNPMHVVLLKLNLASGELADEDGKDHKDK